MPPVTRALSAVAFAAAVAAQHEGVVPAPNPGAGIDFARDVRPILAQHCYTCHGPDDGKRKADLRLDRRADAFAARDTGAAFVAGDPDGSEAWRRMQSDDPDERMPPPDAATPLKPAELDTVRRWLAAGAPWAEHWAFVPPARPEPPPVAAADWPRSDLDRFVLARLEREGLQPSPEAPRHAWLRRVTFDLIGLPPTPAELDAFARDRSADAHERVVDRLLADPRYGERQASEWLDVARYADSSGYQRDTPRQAWKWRDWVVDAFNQGMRFDQFTIEQLAGDLLPEPTLAQRIATGFNRNHPVNTEAGEELDEYRSAYVIDRVHTTATTWLGLSVACAQCHDHKYDPITQREFYGLYAFFNQVKERDNGRGRNPKPAIAAPGPDEAPRLLDLELRIRALEQRLERDDPLTDAAEAEWTRATMQRLGPELPWTTLAPTELMARHGSRLVRQDDGSILATGPVPARDTYDLVFVPGKRTVQALRLEVLPDPSLPHGASGRADDGRFILSGLELRLASVADSSDPPPVVFATAQADVNQRRDEDEHYLTAIEPGPITAAVGGGDGRSKFGGWSVAGDARKEPREVVLIPIEPLACNDTSVLRLVLTHGSPEKFRSLIGRFRVSATDDPRVRTLLLPLQPGLWHTLGPFPAPTVEAAFATAFAPETDVGAPAWKKKYEQPAVPPAGKGSDDKGDGAAAKAKDAKDKRDETAAAPVVPKPDAPAVVAAAAPAEGPPGPEDAGEGEGGGEPQRKKPKPRRLEWQEQRDWRDGERARLQVQGAASAWYVGRRIHCETARTMVLEFDGGIAAKVWRNGTLVGEYEPVPERPPDPAAAAAKPEEAFDEAMAFGERSSQNEREPHRLRVGLRAGDNHLVLKLVGKGAARPAPGETKQTDGGGDDAEPPAMAMAMAMAMRRPEGGLAFRATLHAEGDDLLDYETMLALRTQAAEATSPAGPPAAAEAAASPAASAATPAPAAAPAAASDGEQQPRTPAERRAKVVRRWYRTRIDVAGRALAEELGRLKAEKDRVEAKLPSALVMEELKTPRPTHVFVRGDYRQKGEAVQAHLPAALPPLPARLPANRLGLAQWLMQPDHPLTARVTVNRAWQQFFGLGLVRTADDFGIRGAPPSHPELLDWLATGFVQSGFDVKRLHRQLVLSATYRQASEAPPGAWARDPENVLLARGPRQRLTAEMVRDQALAVGDLLVQKLGGPSVKPYQPPGLWKSMLGGGDWKNDAGDDARRRGLYVYWKRGVPYPSFTIFDASKRETCTVTRTRTTTPLQALVTLNDPVQVEAGRALGKRLLAEGGKDDAARLSFGFRLVASRPPEARELAILQALLADTRKHYEADPAAADLVLGKPAPKPRKQPKPKAAGAGGDAAPTPAAAAAPAAATPAPQPPASVPRPGADAGPSAAEAAAWAQLGCTLLNLEAAMRRG